MLPAHQLSVPAYNRCSTADVTGYHRRASQLRWALRQHSHAAGVESFAGPEFGSPAARRQEKPVGLSKAGAQSWTEGQQCEVGYRSFSAAALHRKISLKHRQHVSVTVDVHVRPCCYSSMFHWAMLIFRLQCFFSDPSVRSDSSVDSRLPKHISNAQCLTTGCLSPQGGGEDRGLEAKPIKYEVLVLHRVLKPSKKKGRKARKQYIFTLGTEVITAGCTCVRPTVIPQG
uniref:Interleukin-17F-like n=1 Tax=Haplochromis burtoni TaxID=8153 RepID=A0A3Q2X026_HAPBU